MNILSSAELERLCRELAEHITSLRDPAVVAPVPGDFQFRSGNGRDNSPSFEVDIEMGGFILSICATDWELETLGQDKIADLTHLLSVRVKEAARARLSRIRQIQDARDRVVSVITAADAGIELLGVRPVPWRLTDRLLGFEFKLAADVRLYDAMLRPQIRRIEGWTPTDLARKVRDNVAVQRRRGRNLKRLAAAGAVLEIDAIAEAALKTNKMTVSKFLAKLPPEKIDLTLVEDDSGSVRLSILDGRIISIIRMREIGLLLGDMLRIDRAIPATIASGLIGSAASALIDYPLLAKGTKITKVHTGEHHTDIKLKVATRVVDAAELEMTIPLAEAA